MLKRIATMLAIGKQSFAGLGDQYFSSQVGGPMPVAFEQKSRGKGGKQGARKPSGAAAAKRAAKKRNNIRKRTKK